MSERVRAGLPLWKARCDGLLRLFHWTPEHLQQLAQKHADDASDEPLEVCPEDSSHVMPREAMTRHVWRCRLLKQGLNPDRFVLLPSSVPAYANATGVVSFLSGHGEYALARLSEDKRHAQPTLSFLASADQDGGDSLLVPDERRGPARTMAELIEWTSGWRGIPFSQRRLSTEDLDGALMSAWIMQHAERLGVGNILRDTDDANFVVELVKTCSDAVSVASELRPMLGDSTLSAWCTAHLSAPLTYDFLQRRAHLQLRCGPSWQRGWRRSTSRRPRLAT